METSVLLGSTGVVGSAVAVIAVFVQRHQTHKKDSFDQYYKLIEGIDGNPIFEDTQVPNPPGQNQIFVTTGRVQTWPQPMLSKQVARIRELGNHPDRLETTEAIFAMWRADPAANVLANPYLSSAAEAAIRAASERRTDQWLVLLDTSVFVLTAALTLDLLANLHRGSIRMVCLTLAAGLGGLIVTGAAVKRPPGVAKAAYGLILAGTIIAIVASRMF